MNIWILNHYATTPDEPTTRSYDIAKILGGKGHTVTIFASSFSHYTFSEKRFKKGEGSWKKEEYDGVRFVWIKTFPYSGNNWRRAMNMLSYAWIAFIAGMGFKEKPDLIIGTCVHPLAVVSAYILSIFKKGRFVFEVTDLWPQTLIDMGAISAKSPAAWGLRIMEKFLFQKADKIVVLLPHADEYICSLGIPKDKIVWIPNGIDSDRYKTLKTYNGGDATNFCVMFLGGHTRYAGLNTVLEAAKILQNEEKDTIRFVFVGDGVDKPNLIKQAEALRLHNVEFRNQVPKNEVVNVMGEADAFISIIKDIPVLRYGISSNKLNDYLISGRPIIFSIKSSNNPVEDSGAGITIPPDNPEAMARAVENLFSLTPDERIQMGKKGIEYVLRHYEIKALAEKMEKYIIDNKANSL